MFIPGGLVWNIHSKKVAQKEKRETRKKGEGTETRYPMSLIFPLNRGKAAVFPPPVLFPALLHPLPPGLKLPAPMSPQNSPSLL
jgi:hypothetical protein